MKKQFMQHLFDLKFVANLDPRNHENNRNSENISLIKAVICAGLYPNVAVGRGGKSENRFKSFSSMDDITKRFKFHPKSVLSKAKTFPSPLVVYYRRLKSSSDFIHDATMVHPLPIIFFGDKFDYTRENESDIISINESLTFKAEGENTVSIIREMRDRLNWFLEHKITHPGSVDWNERSNEINLLRAIMELITNEDLGDIDDEEFDEDYDNDFDNYY
ncbi:hypothetical protein JTB14_000310 [Gonioctena quinquepunctata]|nr:hypothetical protein JTB14_000310 [Gonioctena quinquepunctata]